MSTLNAGQSATVALGAFSSLTVALGVPGRGSLAAVSRARILRSDVRVTELQSKTYGPYGVPMSVTLSCTDGSLEYTENVGAGEVTASQATALAALVGAGPFSSGTLAGTPTAEFSISADTGERLDSVWVVVNPTDDLQAADLVLAKTPTTILYARDGFEDQISSQTRIYSVAIVGLASTTYAAGHSVSSAESTAETIRGALYLIDAPTAIEASYVKFSYTPVLVAGVLNSATVNVTFAP